jgi:hypothetical protein
MWLILSIDIIWSVTLMAMVVEAYMVFACSDSIVLSMRQMGRNMPLVDSIV